MDADRRLACRDCPHVGHLRDVLELRLEAIESARSLQAAEYHRRLDILNHAAEQLAGMHARYVGLDVYSAHRLAESNRLDRVERLVYIGLGIMLALQGVIAVLARLVK